MIALQTNGEILVFSLLCPTGQLMYKSEPYTVVMYKVGRVMNKLKPIKTYLNLLNLLKTIKNY